MLIELGLLGRHYVYVSAAFRLIKLNYLWNKVGSSTANGMHFYIGINIYSVGAQYVPALSITIVSIGQIDC